MFKRYTIGGFDAVSETTWLFRQPFFNLALLFLFLSILVQNLEPWWWSSGHCACLLFLWSEFEATILPTVPQPLPKPTLHVCSYFSTSNFLRQAWTNFLHQIEVGSTGQRLLTLEDRVTYCRASIFSSFVSLSRARASDTNICNCCRRSICYGYNGKNFFSLLWFLIKACLPTSLFLSFLLDELQAIANLKLHQTF